MLEENTGIDALLDRLPVGVGVVDIKERTLSLNAAGLELHGFSTPHGMSSELARYWEAFELRTPDGRVVPPEEWPLARAMRGEHVQDAEVRLRRLDTSHEKVVTFSARQDADEAGAVDRIHFVIHDITHRQQAESELLRYRALVESQAELLCRFRPDGTILFSNEAYARALNSTAERLTGANLWEFVAARDREAVKAQLATLSPDNPEVQIENRFVSAEGERWTLWTNRGLAFDESGRLVEAQSTGIDITARKQAEEALRESEQRFRDMADHAPMMVWLTGVDGACVFLSQSWYEFTGQTPETGLGFGWLDAAHPDDRAGAERTFLQATMMKTAFSIEYRLRRADGVYRWAIDSARPWVSARGEFQGFIGSVIDISERKQVEDALQLADRRKDEFLATLAHELRNPLAPIRNSVELLRMGARDDEVKARALAIIDRQLSQMVLLVDDLLDVSRITLRKVQLRRERVALASVVASALESAHSQVESGGHEVSIALPSEPVYVDGDATRLAQVFANLLTNAAKYSERAGHIWLSAWRTSDEVVVSVRDTGIGIAPEDLPHVFTMFFQVAPALERSQGGLGIGLSLVRGLVEMHGGRVEARSGGTGKGSEFVVRLPIVDGPGQLTVAAEHGPDESAGASPTRILVVDDNRDSVETMAMLLSLKGHQVRTAHDGVEAVQEAAVFRPHLVLLDIGMPRMNGYETAREIRQYDWGRAVRLVAMTGWGQDEDKQRAREAGFDHHLTKPVDLAELEELLRQSRAP
jgi:PAS domain S-box-containing protein